MTVIEGFIREHPVIFSIFVFIAFVGYARSLYIYMSKRRKK